MDLYHLLIGLNSQFEEIMQDWRSCRTGGHAWAESGCMVGAFRTQSGFEEMFGV